MATVNALHAPTKVKVNDAVRQLRRDLKAERLFRMWAQLRREYWLGRRPEDISSRSLDLRSSDGEGPFSAEWVDSSGSTGEAEADKPRLHDVEDVEEFPLQLQCEDVRALIETARHEGLSAAGLARRLIGDYLRRSRSTLQIRNGSAERSHP
jgi:hypothetical protein